MYTTKILRSEQVAEGTRRFSFEKPEDFHFQAGQSIDLYLINPPETDEEGNKRAYSLSSAPHEAELALTTRMRETAFKRSLVALPSGTLANIDGPFGDFSLHESAARPAVFLAGGIGITPFFSIIKDATHRALPHSLTLLYANRRPEDAPFLEELRELETQNKNLKVVPRFTKTEGYIDAVLIKQHAELGASPVFYLAGPAPMVVAMRELLQSMGISNDDIRTEEFTGY